MWYNDLCLISLTKISNTTRKKLNNYKNAVMFQNVFSRLSMDALKRYEFKGLPETISDRVLKQSLLWYGGTCIFEKDGSLMGLPAVPTGDGFNIYGDPAKVWTFSRNNGYNKEVDVYIHGGDESAFLRKGMSGSKASKNAKGVYIRENALAYPFINQTMFFAEAISDTMRTLDVCRVNIKNPFIITCEESVKPSVERYMAQRKENEEYIISSGGCEANKIQVIPVTTNSESLDACTSLIEWYENKYRELCGITNSTGIDKKGENLIQAEIGINNDYTELNPEKSIEYIQMGLDDVNKLFGTSITVEKREKDVPEPTEGDNPDSKEKKGDNDNEDISDDN